METSNGLLARLGPRTRARLSAQLEPRLLEAGTTLVGHGETIDWVCFPTEACIAAITMYEDGTRVETGRYGSDGAAGLEALFGDGVADQHLEVRVGGEALFVQAKTLADFVDAFPRVGGMLRCYAQSCLASTQLFAACNATHDLKQRLAGWLLATGATRVHQTQEELGEALGVGRPRISTALAAFARAGAIRVRRGSVDIVARRPLRALACDCWQNRKAVRERMLPPTP